MTVPRTVLIFVVEESPTGGYEARALGESIFIQGDDLDQLHDMVRDAIDCHFEDDTRPRMVRLHFVRDELIAV